MTKKYLYSVYVRRPASCRAFPFCRAPGDGLVLWAARGAVELFTLLSND